MGRNFSISLGLHAVFLVVAYVGLPSFRHDTAIVDVPMVVEILTVADVTNVPVKVKKPQPVQKAKPKPPPKPPAPPPPPPVEKAALAVPPEVKLEAKPKPKEKPQLQAKPQQAKLKQAKPKKVARKSRTPARLPPRKPKAPDAFASVLKTLEKLKKAPSRKVKAPAKDFSKMMAAALDVNKPSPDLGTRMTISEIDLVRQQIRRCWSPPVGAKDAQTMQIPIRIAMNPDGNVRTARILDQARMASDTFYRAMAESALRAVLNPACQPFKLPPEKFARWKNIKLNFDPKDMFGL